MSTMSVTSRPTRPMRLDVKTEWVRRLRSGDYLQGRRYLRHVASDGQMRYCCLGVLCEVALDAGNVVERIDDVGLITTFKVGGVNLDNGVSGYISTQSSGALPYSSVLPPQVGVWAGLGRARSPYIGSIPLSVMNDNYGMHFDKIADQIEAFL